MKYLFAVLVFALAACGSDRDEPALPTNPVPPPNCDEGPVQPRGCEGDIR